MHASYSNLVQIILHWLAACIFDNYKLPILPHIQESVQYFISLHCFLKDAAVVIPTKGVSFASRLGQLKNPRVFVLKLVQAAIRISNFLWKLAHTTRIHSKISMILQLIHVHSF
jgi:hypothetical protein